MRQLGTQTFVRRYHIVGAVAVGKSTAIESLRCFTTYEEWRGRPPAKMYQNHEKLSVDEDRRVENFIFEQTHEKNDLMKESRLGLFIMDRAHLDLFAFSKGQEDVLRKATRLHDEFGAGDNSLLPAHIFFIRANKEAFEERLMKRSTGVRTLNRFRYDADDLVDQQNLLSLIYRPTPPAIVDTSSIPPDEVARIISRKILLGDYEEFLFSTRVQEVVAQRGAL